MPEMKVGKELSGYSTKAGEGERRSGGKTGGGMSKMSFNGEKDVEFKFQGKRNLKKGYKTKTISKRGYAHNRNRERTTLNAQRQQATSKED